MNSWIYVYGAVFLIGFAVCAVATWLCRRAAIRLDIMDRPKKEAHKLHRQATPLLGGAAMALAWSGCLVGGCLAVRCGWLDAVLPEVAGLREGLRSVGGRMLAILGGALLAAALGLADDCRGMKAQYKFAGQFVVALVAVGLGGVRFTLFIDNLWLTGAMTVLWYMLLMNAINFFDNMDGLAAGTGAIALGFFTVVSAWQGQYFIAALSALSCGVCCGFWLRNRAPAAIYMGDSGSHFLGYLLATVSTSVTYYTSANAATGLTVLLPLFILALPLFDTLAVVVIRARRRKPFWIGDHNHISHRFVRMGMTRPQAVRLVHLLAVIIGLSVIPMLWADQVTAFILFVQAWLLLGLISVLQSIASGKSQ